MTIDEYNELADLADIGEDRLVSGTGFISQLTFGVLFSRLPETSEVTVRSTRKSGRRLFVLGEECQKK